MPALSRWSVRLAFLYLLLGFTWGALILTHKAVQWPPFAWLGFAAHQEFLIFGWTTQFALGIAYWILPRYRGNQRGDIRPAVLAFVALNLGVWFVVLHPWLGAPAGLLGRVLEAGGVLLFVLYAWGRVKPAGA